MPTTILDNPPKPWTAAIMRRVEHTDEPIENIVADVFASGGPMEQCGFPARPGQPLLAALVSRSVDKSGWRMGEGPTGLGKSLSYLIPGILAVRRARARWENKDRRKWRLVVSTANMALQAQIVGKDVGSAAAILGISTSVATVIGRSNYVCPLKLNEGRLTFSGFTTPEVRAEVDKIADWFDGLDDEGGAYKDAAPFAISPMAWARCSTDTDGCAAKGCEHYEPKSGYSPCPAELAKSAAASSEIVVLNHAYLSRAYHALGPVALLVVDEGHNFEDACRGAGERRINKYHAGRMAKLASEVLSKPDAKRLVADPFQRTVTTGRAYLQQMSAVRNGDKRVLRPGWAKPFNPPTLEDFDGVLDVVRSLSALIVGESDEVRKAKFEHAVDQLKTARDRALSLLAGGPTPEDANALPGVWATWAEIDGITDDGAVLATAPADAGAVVRSIQMKIPRCIITSATLAPGGDAAPTEAALGANWAEPTLLLPSPWPLAKMGVLVVPVGPGTKDPLWHAWVDRMVVSAVKAARGRTLVLCTSWARAKAASEAIRSEGLPYPLLVQGEAGRDVLSRRFRDETDSVLVATRSFFEGLDIQGESLSCVVIEKLPFDPPGDPLEDAAALVAAERMGGSPFLARSLPKMVASLAQAAGRLIRSPNDKGAIVILDGRVTEKSGIGFSSRKALPPFPLSTFMGDVGNMLEGRLLLLRDPAPQAVTSGADIDDGTVVRKRRVV